MMDFKFEVCDSRLILMTPQITNLKFNQSSLLNGIQEIIPSTKTNGQLFTVDHDDNEVSFFSVFFYIVEVDEL